MKTRSLKQNAVLSGIRQMCGILFPLITFPYVSRVLRDDGFGQYSFSWSIVSYFVLLAGLGISTYAIREGARIRDDKAKISQFCSEAFTINVVTTFIAFVILIVLTLSIPKIRVYSLLVFIQSLSIILNLIGRDWINSIYEDYFYITIRYIVIQIFSLILMFVCIKTSADLWKYCVITVFSSFGGNIPNIFYVNKYTKIHIVKHPNFKEHMRPMLVLFVTQIAISIYVNADITMLGFFSDDSTVGIYSLSSKIYSMIKTIVNAMVIVTLPRMTYIIDNSPDKYCETLKKVCSYLFIFLMPIACGVFMLSKEVILIVGGSEYQTGSVALKILSGAMIFAVFCSFCMNSILIAHRKEKDCLKATTISALINVVLNLFALPLLGMNGAAVTTIISEAVNLLMLLYSSKKVVSLSFFELKNAIQCIVACSAIILACLGVQYLGFNIIATFIVSFILSVIGYFLILLLTKNIYIIDALKSVRNKVSQRRS